MDYIKQNEANSRVMCFAQKSASTVVPPAILVDDHQLKEVDISKNI